MEKKFLQDPLSLEDNVFIKKETEEPYSNSSNVNCNCDKTIIEMLKTVIENQNNMEKRITNIEKVNDEIFKVQNKKIKENLAITKQVLQTTTRLLGQDFYETQIDISVKFPLSSIEETSDLEEKLKDPSNTESVKEFIQRIRGTKLIIEILKHIMDDRCLVGYNWDGRYNKEALNKLKLFDEILFEIYSSIGRKEYEREMRKAVEMSHNRSKQRKRKLNT